MLIMDFHLIRQGYASQRIMPSLIVVIYIMTTAATGLARLIATTTPARGASTPVAIPTKATSKTRRAPSAQL